MIWKDWFILERGVYSMSDNTTKLLLYIAMLAALIGATADVLLLYNPAGGYEDQTYLFMLDISPDRLMWGHYLGIFFIPLELLGLFHVYKALKPANSKWLYVLFFFSIYSVFPGVVYHGTCAMTATVMKMNAVTPLPAFEEVIWSYWKNLFEPLGLMLALGLLAISILLAYIILKKETNYNKWMAFCSPLTFYLIFLLFYLAIPSIGNFLIPAGFNLAFFFFFACSLWAVKKA